MASIICVRHVDEDHIGGEGDDQGLRATRVPTCRDWYLIFAQLAHPALSETPTPEAGPPLAVTVSGHIGQRCPWNRGRPSQICARP
eukprot:4168802-Amphidinium_carterae.3